MGVSFDLPIDVLMDYSINTLSDVDVVWFVDRCTSLHGVENGVVVVDDGEAKFLRRLCTMGVE